MTNNSTAPTFDGIGHGDPEGDEDHVERVDHGAHVLEEGAHGLRAPPVRPAAANERRREELGDGEALVGVGLQHAADHLLQVARHACSKRRKGGGILLKRYGSHMVGFVCYLEGTINFCYFWVRAMHFFSAMVNCHLLGPNRRSYMDNIQDLVVTLLPLNTINRILT